MQGVLDHLAAGLAFLLWVAYMGSALAAPADPTPPLSAAEAEKMAAAQAWRDDKRCTIS
jgi:hypothetical protein